MKISIINSVARLGNGFKIDSGIWDSKNFIDVYYSFNNKRIFGIGIEY